MTRRFRRPMWLMITGVVVAVALAAPSLAAQGGGMVRGVVRDDKGEPVEGARVTITHNDTSRRFEVKTNRRGEYLQIGLSSGPYTVVAEREQLASPPRTVTVRAGAPAEADFILGVAAAASAAEAAALTAELKKLFEEGVAAGTAGRHEEAIQKFTRGLEINPNCYDCHNNIGFSYTQLKQYDQAEQAYKKAIEVNPNDAAAYNGLANIYNAQRKFDLAAEASVKATELSTNLSAGGGGGADALYNQGVILWNGGKIPEAKKAFEAAIQADPNHAEAHFQLGMALVNEGNLTEAAAVFEKYLALAPSGPNAATAKSLVDQLKK